jgi:PAS domain S-box-containing protein
MGNVLYREVLAGDGIHRPKATWSTFTVFLLVLLLFLASIGLLSARMLREENQRRSHELSVQLLSEQIDHILRQRLRMVQTLAGNPLVMDVVKGKIDPQGPRVQLLLETAKEVSGTDVVYIIDRNGTTLSSTPLDAVSIIGYNYTFRPYFQRAMAGETAEYPALGAKSGVRGLHLSAPIYGGKNDIPIGVMALKIDVREVESLLTERKDKIALVSPEGVAFASNQPEWVLHSMKNLPLKVLDRLKKTRQFGDAHIQRLNLDIHEDLVTIENQTYYVTRAPLSITGWTIVSFQKRDPSLPLPTIYKYWIGTGLGVTGGLAILVFFLMANIQHRKRTGMMLRHAEKKYRNIFRNALMGIFQSTIDGRLLDVSPSMADILGYDSPQQLVSSIVNIGDQLYVNPEDRGEFIRQLMEYKEVKGFETRFRRKDGQIIWILVSGRMVSEFNGKEPFIEGFCVDNTEKKDAGEALRRERDIFSCVMETSPVGIILVNRKGEITFANPKAEQILNLVKAEDKSAPYARPVWMFTHLDGTPMTEAELPMSQVLAGGGPIQDARCSLRQIDGRPLLLSVNIAPVYDKFGNIVGLVSTLEDITEKIRAEEEAALRQRQLVLADRMISMGILTSGVAHEINNPNTLILSNAQMLADAWKAAATILDEYHMENGEFLIGGFHYSKFREKLPTLSSRILEGSRRIKRIVKELRDYSRQESGQRVESVNANDVIRSAQILLENMTKESTRCFVLDLDESLPRLRGSFQRLEQVVINLIQNACQALDCNSKGVFVSTSYDATSDKVVIICRDQGVGIPKQHLDHVTDPFFTTKRDSGGTGLGLSISSAIVQELEGTMEISSEPGLGTTVTLRFPSDPWRSRDRANFCSSHLPP